MTKIKEAPKPKTKTRTKATTKKQVVKKVSATLPTATAIVKPAESLAMIHHLHNVTKQHTTPARKFFKFKKLSQLLADDPSLWGLTWALIWRGFSLVLVANVTVTLFSYFAGQLLAQALIYLK